MRRLLATTTVSLALAAIATPASAHPVTLAAHLRALPARVAVGHVVVVDPRATTLPKGDKVTTSTISFGDGAKAVHRGRLTTAGHAYSAAGTYTVTLSVTDAHRKTVRTSRKLTVVAPAAAPRPTATATPAPTAGATTPAYAPPAGPLSGRVLHGSTPLAGIEIVATPSFFGPTAPGSTGFPGNEYRTTTDAHGFWALQAPVGDYWVYVNADPDTGKIGSTAYQAVAGSLTVSKGSSATYDTDLDLPVRLSGALTGPTGASSPGTVTVSQSLGFTSLQTVVQSDAAGRYSVPGLLSEDASLDFLPQDAHQTEDYAEDDLSTAVGTAVENHTFGAAGDLTLTVAGPAGESLPVEVDDDQGDEQILSTKTDGTLEVPHLAAGTYTVTANSPDVYGYYEPDGDSSDPAYTYAIATGQKVVAGSTTAVGTLTLAKGGTVTGTVESLPATPEPGAAVTITTSDNVVYTVTAASDGTFTIPSLPAGTQTVGAQTQDGKSGSSPVVVTAGGSTSATILVS